MRVNHLLSGDVSSLIDQDVLVKGWVRTKRGNKNVAFIALNDGSTINNIQIVVELSSIAEEKIKDAGTGACISCVGKLVKSMGQGQSVEIQAPVPASFIFSSAIELSSTTI